MSFSFSEKNLSRNLDTLTHLNNDFVALSDLIILRPPPLSLEVLAGKHTKKRLTVQHQAIREAATAINASLIRLSCKSPGPHLADLCLGTEEVVYSEKTPSIIEFDAAFHCPTSCCEFLHLSVSRSLVDNPYRVSIIGPNKLEARLVSVLLDEESSKDLEQTSEPRAAFEARRSIPSESIAPEKISKRQSVSVPGWDVCEFLSHSIQGFDDGVLHLKASLIHDRENQAGAPMTRSGECALKSEVICLSDLLGLPPDATYRMPIYKRFWLAKTLAVAFYRYSRTYWAESGWDSKRVFFHTSDTADIYQSSTLHQPWLRCSVRDFTHPITYGMGGHFWLGRSAKDLFTLGAMLIEIGSSMNWESLGNTYKDAVYETYGRIDDDTLKSFFQARRFNGQGLFDMGSTYRSIVEKLTDSLFENRYDLDDQRSQGDFIGEIIRPLEEEERKLRDVLYGKGSRGAQEGHTSA